MVTKEGLRISRGCMDLEQAPRGRRFVGSWFVFEMELWGRATSAGQAGWGEENDGASELWGAGIKLSIFLPWCHLSGSKGAELRVNCSCPAPIRSAEGEDVGWVPDSGQTQGCPSHL